MKPRSVLYVVIAVLLAILVIKNWAVISPSTQLDLIFVDVKAPLGVLLLLIAGAILAINFVVNSFERRGLAAQIEQLRLRADEAEESRIRGLREVMEREMAEIRRRLDELIVRK